MTEVKGRRKRHRLTWVMGVANYKSGPLIPSYSPNPHLHVLVMWPCNPSPQEVRSISPLPESGPALWFVRINRMRQTWCFRSSKPRPQENLHLPLSCFSWEFCNHYNVNEPELVGWMMDTGIHGSVSPIAPASHLPADCRHKWTPLNPAEEPPGLSQPPFPTHIIVYLQMVVVLSHKVLGWFGILQKLTDR